MHESFDSWVDSHSDYYICVQINCDKSWLIWFADGGIGKKNTTMPRVIEYKSPYREQFELSLMSKRKKNRKIDTQTDSCVQLVRDIEN